MNLDICIQDLEKSNYPKGHKNQMCLGGLVLDLVFDVCYDD